MACMMTFPNTWEEFEQFYGITDTEEIYTNGARLIPSFRVKQWLDHAQPEQGWIPVSERLPEEGKDALLTYKNNMVVGHWKNICGEVTWYANSGDGWFTTTGSVFDDGIPIAWMPLPEPHKGETDD